MLQVLESGGATKYVRAVMLAELLLQDAELSETKARVREAVIRRAQARALLAASVDHLAAEDQASYRPKLEALDASFRNSRDSR
jgi:ubiquinone biosynthesis protein COQ9